MPSRDSPAIQMLKNTFSCSERLSNHQVQCHTIYLELLKVDGGQFDHIRCYRVGIRSQVHQRPLRRRHQERHLLHRGGVLVARGNQLRLVRLGLWGLLHKYAYRQSPFFSPLEFATGVKAQKNCSHRWLRRLLQRELHLLHQRQPHGGDLQAFHLPLW